ncbi:MAG: AAA family ATPase [Candidatus Auribacterota bacterium]|jgi:chromosome partitioning protein|nr:AAA family ATPase [Candidatus Auribacterota bacterium]
MRIISVVNQKGGCGKTTTAVNLSDCLALHHRKVLLIDLDPQSNATLASGIKDDEINKCMYDVLCNKVPLRSVPVEKYPNFFVAPSRVTLSAVEQFLAGQQGRETVLRDAIQQVKNDFDYIILDCPPSIGLLTFNALRASSEAIIPIEMSCFSIQGLGRLLGTIELMQERTNHTIAFRAVPTLFDRRTKYSWDFLDEIRRHFGDRMFSTKIHTNVRLKEAASAGKPISRFDTGSLGFFDYDQLAKEIIAEEPKIQSIKTVESPLKTERGIQFRCFAPNAQNVQLVGDFNNWSPNQIYLENKNGDGDWNKTLLLPKGRYQYRFIVDGSWVHDKNNQQAEYSPYGGLNSVLEV